MTNIASKNEINSIVEIFLNFLNNNIHCGKAFVKSMKKHFSYFDKLTKRSFSLNSKKKLLSNKTGGFILQALLSLAIPIITKLFIK